MVKAFLDELELINKYRWQYALGAAGLVGGFGLAVGGWWLGVGGWGVAAGGCALVFVGFAVWRMTLGSPWLYANDGKRKPLRWWVGRGPWWVGLVGLGLWLAVNGMGVALAILFDGGQDVQ